jgi:hypothetical protein
MLTSTVSSVSCDKWCARIRLLVTGGLISATYATGASAQNWRPIQTDAACSQCRTIQLQRAVSLGSEIGEGYVSSPAGIAFWRSHWILTHWAKRSSMSIYTHAGEFVRDVGRNGDGPGEFRLAGRLLVSSDTLFVLDHALARVTAYDSLWTLLGTRSVPTGNAISFDRTPSGQFILSAVVNSRETMGRPLHLLTPDGERISSFGVDTIIVRPDLPHRNQRLIALGPMGDLWSVRRTDYVLERWDLSGEKRDELRRGADWFPPHGRGGFVARDKPPNPTINAFWIDSDDRAWIGIEVPDAEWRRAVVSKGIVQGRELWGFESEDAYYDTIIEVVDLRSGRLVARGRMDQALTSARYPGLIVTYREAKDGSQVIDVWRPRINPNQRVAQ